MANVYYSHPSNRRGILRAVVSSEKVRAMLAEYATQSAGHHFPMTADSANDDFAILQLFEVEASEKFAAGFYLFEEDIERIEAELQR